MYSGELCLPHRKRLVTGEIPADKPIKYIDSTRGCAAPGCGRRHRTGGYCNAHYAQMLYTGDLKDILYRAPKAQYGLTDDHPTYPAAHNQGAIPVGSS